MNWQPIKTEGGSFTVPDLVALEKSLINQTKTKSESWFRGVWKWILMSGFLVGNINLKKFMQITGETLDLADAVKAIEIAAQVGIRSANADMKAPAPKLTGPLGEQSRKTPLVPPKMPPRTPSGPTLPPVSPNKQRLNALWYARTSGALKMKEWANGMRDDVRWQVVEAIKQGLTKDQLARRLEERWDKYGQNFQVIAVTELNDAFNAGYLLSLPEKSYVTVPKIDDDRVCEKCKELLEDKVFEVLHHPPEHLTRQVLETCVWSGKSNVGRKKEDWVPCVSLHPSCRHRYKFVSGPPLRREYHDF